MKKIILLFIFLLISALAYFGYNVIQKKTKEKEISERILNLPQFSFQKLDGKMLKSDELEKEKPLVITYFHPECEHCQYEISEIVKNKDSFKEVNYLFISGASVEDVRNFSKNYGMDELESSIILRDTAYEFEEIFGKAYYPTTLIYNKNEKLVEKIVGEVKVEKIIELVKNE